MEERSRRRVTLAQLEVLWEVLNENTDVALGYNKSATARERAKRMWDSVAQSLNSLGEGACKDGKGWSNYWVDYKSKLKKKVAAIKASQHRTGGGPPDSLGLADIEKKFLGILGEDFGEGLPGIQVDPFPPNPESMEVEGGGSASLLTGIELAVVHSQQSTPSASPAAALEETEDMPQDVQTPPPEPEPSTSRARHRANVVTRRSRRNTPMMTANIGRQRIINNSGLALEVARSRLEVERRSLVVAESNHGLLQQIASAVSSIAESLARTRAPEAGDEGAPSS